VKGRKFPRKSSLAKQNRRLHIKIKTPVTCFFEEGEVGGRRGQGSLPLKTGSLIRLQFTHPRDRWSCPRANLSITSQGGSSEGKKGMLRSYCCHNIVADRHGSGKARDRGHKYGGRTSRRGMSEPAISVRRRTSLWGESCCSSRPSVGEKRRTTLGTVQGRKEKTSLEGDTYARKKKR